MTQVPTDREPRVVPTTALGYRFRSTTEARWAIFLRALGVAFEYEPETYDLGSLGWYLPDFRLPELDMHLEVKGSRPLLDIEYDKARALFLLTQRPVLVAQGFGRPPWDDLANYMIPLRDWPGQLYDIWTRGHFDQSAGLGGNGHHFSVCVCGRVGIGAHGMLGIDCTHRPDPYPRKAWDVQRIERAYDEALAFRPDHR